MTISELVQLYAPLAGLLVLAFWVGALSQRVKNLEQADRDRKRADDDQGSIRDRLTRIETKFESTADDVAAIKRSMDGVQRQLGNLMINKATAIEINP